MCCQHTLTKVDTQCDRVATIVGQTKLTILAAVAVRPMSLSSSCTERLPLCTARCIWGSLLHVYLWQLLLVFILWKFYAIVVVALQRAEMRMVRWMCGVKLKDRLPSKELRERLGVDDIALILQQNRLRWYGHVLRKDDDDWVNKCMEYEVEGLRPRGRPKRTWREVVRGLSST